MKLRAARVKLKAFQRSYERFVASEPFRLVPRAGVSTQDSQVHVISVRCSERRQAPDERWTNLIDELTYNLRSALDSAVHDLSTSPDRGNPNGTGFPICVDKAKFNRRLVRYLSEKEQEFVGDVQPYGQPDNPLWPLVKWNNLYKHRTPRFTVVLAEFDPTTPERSYQINLRNVDLVHLAYATPDRLEDDLELVRITYRRLPEVDPHIEVNVHLAIDVRLDDRSIMSDVQGGGVLSQMVSSVEHIIHNLYALRG